MAKKVATNSSKKNQSQGGPKKSLSASLTTRKSKKHGIGLKKEVFTVDPTGGTPVTVTVFVDGDLPAANILDAEVDSKSHKWIDSDFLGAETLNDSAGDPIVTVVRATARCLKRKGSGYYNGDDDLIVTVTYDDTETGDAEDDECTFTDVEYSDTTVALRIKAKNDHPR